MFRAMAGPGIALSRRNPCARCKQDGLELHLSTHYSGSHFWICGPCELDNAEERVQRRKLADLEFGLFLASATKCALAMAIAFGAGFATTWLVLHLFMN